MASSTDFIDYVCEQIAGVGQIRSRKMFGDYMIYVDDRPALLVCDNTVYVKNRKETAALMPMHNCNRRTTAPNPIWCSISTAAICRVPWCRLCCL